MKKFSDYIRTINEELTEYTLVNVTATYTPVHDMIVKIPREWEEEDIKNYLIDKYSVVMPSSPDKSEKCFGVNAENIADASFSFDEIVDNSTYEGDDAVKLCPDDTKDDALVTVILKGFKFVIIFDTFKINSYNTSSIAQDLNKIFVATEDNNDYPCQFKVNTEYTLA